MSNSKGYINLGIIVLIIILVLAMGAFVKKNFFASSGTNQSSEIGFRFDTRYGGEFDVNYTNKYFAAQDYFNKSVNFKLTGCQDKCETLTIAGTKHDLSESKNFTIEGKEYALKKFANSDGTTTLIMNPKWTDKLGIVEIKSYHNIEEPSIEFYKIIGSLQFVKEIPVVEIPQSPNLNFSASSMPFVPLSPNPQSKPYLTQTGIVTISAQSVTSDFLSQTAVFEHQYFSMRYPKSWELRTSDRYPVIIENPEGAWDSHSHAGVIHKNSFSISEVGSTTQSVEDIMKDLDQKRDVMIKREYEVWQETKAQDSRVPGYQQYYKPYVNKQKIVKGDVEYIIFNDSGADYFIASNKKAWVRGTGSYINDKNSIERKMLESVIPK